MSLLIAHPKFKKRLRHPIVGKLVFRCGHLLPVAAFDQAVHGFGIFAGDGLALRGLAWAAELHRQLAKASFILYAPSDTAAFASSSILDTMKPADCTWAMAERIASSSEAASRSK